MKTEHKVILDLLTDYLSQEGIEHLRFGQALFNLGINEFATPNNPEEGKFLLRDIHNDDDGRIINRILKNK